MLGGVGGGGRGIYKPQPPHAHLRLGVEDMRGQIQPPVQLGRPEAEAGG
eukprot:COSAG01_NODE_65902_length_264_cov_0.381503_1_plen_48_part_01